MKRRNLKVGVWFVAVLFLMAGLNSDRLHAQQVGVPDLVLHYADTVLYNGKILTADDKFTIVEAVAIRDGKFLALGPTNRILPLAGPKTRKIDLKGKTAMPGMVDTHMHPFTEGIVEYYEHKYLGRPIEPINSMEADAEWDKASADEILGVVQKAVARVKPGEVVIIHGGSGRGGYGLCRKITLEQLDSVSPNNPFFFISTVNVWVDALNSKGASLLHLPEGVSPFFDPGLPCASDAARERGDSTIHWLTPLEELLPAFRAGARRTNEWGITTAKEHTTPPLMAGIRELWVRGELTVRMRMPLPLWPKTGNQTNPPPDEAEDLFKSLGNLSGIGDDMWRLNCVRPEAVGGSLTSGGAWTIEPKLHGLPGLPDLPYGAPTWFEEKVQGLKKESFVGREALVQAVRYGWDIAADHTIGDRAVGEVLKAMEEGLKTQVVKRPGQILAMGHTPMAKPEHLQKMKELGIRNGIGPYHVFTKYKIDAAFTQYGTERIGQMAAFNSYLKLGLRPSLEGDTFGDPPFWKFYVAVTRKDQRYGRAWNPTERVTRQEALWMATINGAYQLGEENKLGSIEAGKLADLVVIDQDYMSIPEDEIPKINVLLTIVGGKAVYEAQGGLK